MIGSGVERVAEVRREAKKSSSLRVTNTVTRSICMEVGSVAEVVNETHSTSSCVYDVRRATERRTTSSRTSQHEANQQQSIATFSINLNDCVTQWGLTLMLTSQTCVERFIEPSDAHCCHMGTAMKRPVPDRVKPSFVISDIRALCLSALSVVASPITSH